MRLALARWHAQNKLLQRQRDELEGVGAGAVYGGGPVEVRASDAAGGTNLAEEGTGIDEIAGLHGDARSLRPVDHS